MILSPRQEKLVALRDEMAPGYRPAAIVPRTFAEIELMCKALAGANLVPKAFKDKPTDMILVVMTGLEVGIPPMAALRLYTTWDGVPRLMAEGIRGVLLAHPDIEYFEPETGDDKHATWVGKRRGRPEKKATWTIERARRAELLGKDNWRKYPEDMLNARASMQLGRMIAPDIMAGMVSREEASDGDFIDAQATETRSSGFVAPPPANGGSGGGVLIVGSTTSGFVNAPPEVAKQFPQVATTPTVVNIAPVGSPNAQSTTVAPQGPPPGVPQPPTEKPKRERGAAAVRPTSAQPPSAGSTAPAASSATSQPSSAASTATASQPSEPDRDKARADRDETRLQDIAHERVAPMPTNPTPPASSTSPSPSAESAQTSSSATGAAAPDAPSQSSPADDFGGEDPVDTPAQVDPVEVKLAEFHAWLKGCATQRDLVGGLAAWRAWSKDMSDTHGDLRFRKGGEITIAMQDAYSKRKGEVPA